MHELKEKAAAGDAEAISELREIRGNGLKRQMARLDRYRELAASGDADALRCLERHRRLSAESGKRCYDLLKQDKAAWTAFIHRSRMRRIKRTKERKYNEALSNPGAADPELLKKARKWKSNKDYYDSPEGKAKVKAYAQKYYKEHSEKAAERNKAWRARNIEFARARGTLAVRKHMASKKTESAPAPVDACAEMTMLGITFGQLEGEQQNG